MVGGRAQRQEVGRSGESLGKLRRVGTQVPALKGRSQGACASPTAALPPRQSGSHVPPRLGSPIQNLLQLGVPSTQHRACF